MLDVLDILMEKKVVPILHEDNETALGVIKTGKTHTMRHLGRTHEVDIAWLNDLVKDGQITAQKCPSEDMRADTFTKSFSEPNKWHRACKLIGHWFPGQDGSLTIGENARECDKGKPVGETLVTATPCTKLPTPTVKQKETNNNDCLVYVRIDKNAETYQTTEKGGPTWDKVRWRTTIDSDTGEVLEDKAIENIRDEELHRSLDRTRNITTILEHDAERHATVAAPSTTLTTTSLPNSEEEHNPERLIIEFCCGEDSKIGQVNIFRSATGC